MLQKFRDKFNHNLCKIQYWWKKVNTPPEILPPPPSIKPKSKRQIEVILNEWRKKGKPIPPPYAYKQAEIRKYAKKFNLKTLIETGTYLGETPIELQKYFKKIHTIELDKDLFEQAKMNLKPLKNVRCWQGDSARVLAEITQNLRSDAIFWLDAHFSGGVTARAVMTDTPIIKELDVILERSKKDVLLIDDARCFDGKGDYPTLTELKDFILIKRPGSVFEVKLDIIRVVLSNNFS